MSQQEKKSKESREGGLFSRLTGKKEKREKVQEAHGSHRAASLEIPSGMPKRFTPTRPEGLTEEEVEKIRRAGGANVAKNDHLKSPARIVASNLFTLFNLLNIALAVCLLLVGSYRNMLFLGVVISNTLIGTIQELRARKTVQKLQLLHMPQTRVLRGGAEEAVKPDELVRDDLIVLHPGEQVPADALVRDGRGAADESLLTGESDPVQKGEGDWLLSGSYVTEGRFTAQLVYVGDQSYASRLTSTARRIKAPKSVLMNDLNKLVRAISALLVPIGGLLMIKQYFILKLPLQEAVPRVVAAMIGMIPEGLILLTSVALMVGVIRLGKKETLVSELFGIESLARADVLCLDKTGTLTTGRMKVEEALPVDGTEEELKNGLSRFLSAFDDESPTLNALRAWTPPADPVDAAILPFSSRRKKSAASFADGTTLILGAPSFVLDDVSPYQDRIEPMTEQGYRVIVLCEASGPISAEECPPIEKVLGLIGLSDELRPNVNETLNYFTEQDVRLCVISGDDAVTVSRIAKKAGLPGAEHYVDASTLLDDEDIRKAVREARVFGRVTPDQKKKLVSALQEEGHTVAMTGDGVNDIPALKKADCSIAMGTSVDAVRGVAQMTLLSGDFSGLPEVVGEGRRVIGNVRRTATLFLVKTIFSALLSILTLILPLQYPFQPIQLTLLSSLTIGIPAFFLALEPNKERVEGDFLSTVIKTAAPGGVGVAVSGILASALTIFGLSWQDCSTVAVLAAAVIGLTELGMVSWPLTWLRAAVLAMMTAALTLVCLRFHDVFFLSVYTMPDQSWIALGVVLAVGFAAMFLTPKLYPLIHKWREKKL